jgi:uncharacterized membrane protein YraQ (UPF0718 family)
MDQLLAHIGSALRLAGTMFWEVLWPLTLGFLLSAAVETLASKQAVSRALGRDSAGAVAAATLLGAVSSSCSYAAVAVARTLFRKGASLANAIVFEFASTNLVFELGLALLILMGWQFVVAEFSGGILMVVLLAVLFRLTLRRGLVARARTQAARGLAGRMEGHAAMDMSVTEGPLLSRALSPQALTSVSHNFFMNVYSLWSDLLIGFLVAGALGAWVPDSFWSRLFLTGHGALSEVWGAVIGPLVALMSFVCSVGNVPLAAVLWRGGISFSGVTAFIFGDLIILPILSIYRRYYTGAVAGYLLIVSYAAMVLAGLAVGAGLQWLGLHPGRSGLQAFAEGVSWNADTVLDIASLILVAFMLVRFLATGGIGMLRAMNVPHVPQHQLSHD